MQKVIEFAEAFKQQVAQERSKIDTEHVNNPSSSITPQDEQDIKVCIRYRPLLEQEAAQGNFSCASLLSSDTIALHKPEFNTRTSQPTITTERISVDLAFGEHASNDEVFSQTAHDLIPLALGGGVGTLFAYGQTSAGKTHTLVGIQERVASSIFSLAEEYQKKFKDIPLPSPDSLLPPSSSSLHKSKKTNTSTAPQNKKLRSYAPSKPITTTTRKPLATLANLKTQPKAKTRETQEAPSAQETQETQETQEMQETAETQATQQTQKTRQIHGEQQNNDAQRTQETQETQQTQEPPIPTQKTLETNQMLNNTSTESTTQTSNIQDTQKESETAKRKLRIFVSFFELLGKNAFDLLAEKKPISILEDKFGDIQLAGIVERQIFSAEEFISNIHNAAALRQSATTLRNDSSSRSHAVCRVRVNNPLFPSSEDGLLMLVDLAGSERAADSRDHSAERIAETKEINSSLMALKECIRARATAGSAQDKFVHVPYRSSKLTVLLKDAFELSSMRTTQTVVIAHVSPCATDVAHSLNTLRYVAPLKVRSGKPAIDPKNPAMWTHEQTVEWIKEAYKEKVDPAILCPYESGLQLCKIPEAEYMRRILLNPGISEKQAKKFYMALWELIVDARTRKRQEAKKSDKTRQKEREKDWEDESKELIERSVAEGVVL
eukprot:Phypoly_transcript_04319.p1 GENE.Phypoly_transcript_04319~~Phypoly_transcript_04319.p1  ORF type:complete len:665 (+),score=140.64 Phypoly_transcript_04319:83-2077(+)